MIIEEIVPLKEGYTWVDKHEDIHTYDFESVVEDVVEEEEAESITYLAEEIPYWALGKVVDVYYPNLIKLPNSAYEDNMDITNVTAPKLEYLGKNAFANSGIRSFDSSGANIKIVDDNAFQATDMTKIMLENPEFIGRNNISSVVLELDLGNRVNWISQRTANAYPSQIKETFWYSGIYKDEVVLYCGNSVLVEFGATMQGLDISQEMKDACTFIDHDAGRNWVSEAFPYMFVEPMPVGYRLNGFKNVLGIGNRGLKITDGDANIADCIVESLLEGNIKYLGTEALYNFNLRMCDSSKPIYKYIFEVLREDKSLNFPELRWMGDNALATSDYNKFYNTITLGGIEHPIIVSRSSASSTYPKSDETMISEEGIVYGYIGKNALKNCSASKLVAYVKEEDTESRNLITTMANKIDTVEFRSSSTGRVIA